MLSAEEYKVYVCLKADGESIGTWTPTDCVVEKYTAGDITHNEIVPGTPFIITFMGIYPNKTLSGGANSMIGTYTLPHAYTTHYSLGVSMDTNIVRIVSPNLTQFQINLYNSYRETSAKTTRIHIISVGY